MGENSPYGMNRGGGGNVGRTRGPFATMLERAETQEAIDLNRSRLRFTRPVQSAQSRSSSASSMTLTLSFWALSSFEPAAVPTRT